MSKPAKSKEPVWLICKPVADALAHAAVEGNKLALLTGYKQGCEIVALAAETLKKINEIVAAARSKKP